MSHKKWSEKSSYLFCSVCSKYRVEQKSLDQFVHVQKQCTYLRDIVLYYKNLFKNEEIGTAELDNLVKVEPHIRRFSNNGGEYTNAKYS